ncbi:MAG: type II toxin-antitoxin system RelE/ParE family toxin [Deltaproteobacteria bacterium]|nr:MAG: type II toxin-antitoxin system RelE/ParE family toxin [Deltaproteobacteria bacterium]
MQLRLSQAARRDLVNVWTYIAEDNAARADTFLDELYELFQTLADNPEIGRRRDELRTGIRSFPKGSYVVFYALSTETEELEIVRVLSGFRDLDKLLED